MLLLPILAPFALAIEPTTCTTLVYESDTIATVATVDLADGSTVAEGPNLALDAWRLRGLFVTDSAVWACSGGLLASYDRDTGLAEQTARACGNVVGGDAMVLLGLPGGAASVFDTAEDAANSEADPFGQPRFGTARAGALDGGVLWTSWGTGNRLRVWSTDTFELTGALALEDFEGVVWGLFASRDTLYVLDDGRAGDEQGPPAIRAFDASTGAAGAVVALELDRGRLPRGLWCDAP